jgi:integral membrane sensor domain MASE1
MGGTAVVLVRVDCDLLGVDCACPLRELIRSRVELATDVVVAILYSVLSALALTTQVAIWLPSGNLGNLGNLLAEVPFWR